MLSRSPLWAFWDGEMMIESTCSGTQSWIIERLNDHFGALPKREFSSLISMIMWTISESQYKGSNFNLCLDCETMFSLCVRWCCFEVKACCQKRESSVMGGLQPYTSMTWAKMKASCACGRTGPSVLIPATTELNTGLVGLLLHTRTVAHTCTPVPASRKLYIDGVHGNNARNNGPL